MRTWLELLTFTALATAVLLLILGAGQLARVADLLVTSGDWLGLLGPTALVLLEAALPLAGLVAAGLVYGRMRAEGALIARAALGIGPARTWGPAVAIGLLLGPISAWLASGPVPDAVVALRGRLVQAAVQGVVRGDAVPLPGGGVVRAVPTDGAPAIWAALPAGEGAPALLHARAARADATSDGLALHLDGVHLWSRDLRVRTGQADIRLDDPALLRRLGVLGPPNALRSVALDPTNRHQHFTWHRRLALPALAPLWALLGALLGAPFGGAWATAASAGAVAGAYWLLRTGELSARAGLFDPGLAAWAPFALLACLLLIAAPRLARRAGG